MKPFIITAIAITAFSSASADTGERACFKIEQGSLREERMKALGLNTQPNAICIHLIHDSASVTLLKDATPIATGVGAATRLQSVDCMVFRSEVVWKNLWLQGGSTLEEDIHLKTCRLYVPTESLVGTIWFGSVNGDIMRVTELRK